MPPTLVLIRHAQAEHNATNDWSIRDPPLTQLGEQQSRELQESLKKSNIGNQIDLIVVSAQRRTLQTATIGLDWLIKKGVPVLPSALWQENADKPCDTGTPIPIISQEFPQYDFSSVDPSFPDKTTNGPQNPYAFTQKAIVERGQSALRELYGRKENVIAVDVFNADWRLFDWDEEAMKSEGRCVLKEREETEVKGGGMGRSDVGVFGIVQGDFPPEDKAAGEEKVAGEATGEKPSA
ncbi:phosphoglycerate mutase [Pyrenophora tritici-repentis]|uniref:Phosphoglycerate mutase n=2 Tax=Pyrenophora tritici-repentis TaxID=45151 RepID=A0A2W1EIQ4_9PLEO|nr:phosphoglycerate mutase [Pyrenophora tritici-repentis Pt-1C-BFP]KAA8627287.1 phosphoglycerate mutase [Pyrenophora tritici-repentis]EDU41769.1 phosphoglycerate mutase [Pyrenophora tritici-repentis Pt-1C-BFP]KAF7578933.1 phosphoglycerate mutase [Pyrenophora tritici-repentis]KAG9377872.1 phosphoglycerate mutase [Pyrenophora tritici-repentis]KAI0583105.1 phosphoglycerate mutase [Pyrenophora tritici-repentis]